MPKIDLTDEEHAAVAAALRKLIAENTTEDVLHLQLAEVEKRHILRVLASTGGNKTRAAKILGIDTKTLYNKLKAYKASDQVARKRAVLNGSLTSSVN
jgi:DNA-binding protein Fis